MTNLEIYFIGVPCNDEDKLFNDYRFDIEFDDVFDILIGRHESSVMHSVGFKLSRMNISRSI